MTTVRATRVRAYAALTWCGASAVAIALAVARYQGAMREPQPDFVGFFLPAARAVAEGGSPYAVDGYFYTPWVALLLAPIAEAPWAAEAWTVARLVAGLAACLVAAVAFAPGRTWWERPALFALAAATLLYSIPVSLELWAGQPNLLVLLGLVCAAGAASRGRALAAGVWAGAVAAVKTWTVLFLVWFLRRGAPARGRSLVGVAIVGAATLGLALVLGGPAGVWAMVTGPFRGAEQPLLAANSVWGIGRMLFSDTPVGSPLVVSPALQITVTVASLIVVLGLMIVSLRRPGPAAIALFNVVLLVLLLLPVSHYYYLILGLPALWWWAAEAARAPRRLVPWAAVAVLGIWWLVTFRIAPEGGGFTSTTWTSLLRIFSFSLLAAAFSVVAAARLGRAARA